MKWLGWHYYTCVFEGTKYMCCSWVDSRFFVGCQKFHIEIQIIHVYLYHSYLRLERTFISLDLLQYLHSEQDIICEPSLFYQLSYSLTSWSMKEARYTIADTEA